ncbi:MAG: Nif3-like dinuclear metal center hexameric protein [Methanospirillaceae archaeon]|nr:Nif3-like dinuclear metal center hexameric protein [Methanospirillaceae archaeon]
MDRDSIIEILEKIAPASGAEEFDTGKIGLIIEGSPEVQKVCTALDLTPRVADLAVKMGADMIVVHHTPIWYPLTAITGERANLFRMVLQASVNIYVMHTNYDNAEGGVNDILADLLSLSDITRMSTGLVGECSLPLNEIADRLKGDIRVFGRERPVRRLAVAGGSCFDPACISEAISLGADAFLSAELRHSVALDFPILLIESTHYLTEAPAMRHLAEKMGWTFLDDPLPWHTITGTR